MRVGALVSGLSAHTRDGAPSVAFMLDEREQPAYGTDRVDAATAAAWAKANGVKTDGPGSRIARINSARFAAGLPGFVIVPDRPGDAPIMAKPATKPEPPSPPAPLARVVVDVVPAPVPARPPGPRTIKSQDEFLDLVTDFDGTLPNLLCTQNLAGWALDTNTANRPMNKTAVERFRSILREGNWKLTGEPIIISRQGILSDGQHRLQAVRDTGIPALMDFRFGIDREAFTATGTGSRRTLGNILAMSGRHHASTQAAIARLVHHYDAHSMARSNQQVEADLVLEIADRESSLASVAAWMSKAKFAPTKTAPFGLVLAVAARHHPLETVFAFADLVASGLADDTNPARLLHIRLRDAAMARERPHQTDVAALGVKAFNAWLTGKPVHRLQLLDADRANETFPQVAAL